jgi:RNA polymerase sigma-70 factor (ECF subfamily)
VSVSVKQPAAIATVPNRTSEDDLRDVERVLAGDANAFEPIVRRWQGPLLNLAYRYLRDRSRAEEVTQETFLRAFKSLSAWRREGAFSTWLFALAINLCRSEFRRIPVQPLPLEDAPEPGDPHDMAAALLAVDRDEAVRRAVHTLPEKYRDALLLYYFQQMDVAAAAAVLQLPTGTVKARLARGRTMLRQKLRPVLEARAKL